MKTRRFRLCILIVGLALALTGAVAAQQVPGGGEPELVFQGVERHHDLSSLSYDVGEGKKVQTLAISLGQPGLSFRYVESLGETGIPYFVDSTHLNVPHSVAVDADVRVEIAGLLDQP